MNGPPDFDIEQPEYRLEPSERWIRVRFGGELIADSRETLLLSWHGPGVLPTYCIPESAVRRELFSESTRGAPPPADFMIPHDIGVDEVSATAAAYLLRNPPEPFAGADGYWTFKWHNPKIEWFEEATRVYSHARDTRHRVDAIPSERHIRVELDGEVLADSSKPVALFESGLPTRWYLPAEDLNMGVLEASDTRTRCPYKGEAEYYSIRIHDQLHRDRVWRYPDPIPENPRIAGLYAFFNEHVDLIVDGEKLKRPFTPWSLDVKA